MSVGIMDTSHPVVHHYLTFQTGSCDSMAMYRAFPLHHMRSCQCLPQLMVHDPLPRRVPTVGGSQVGGSQDIPSGTPEDSSHQALFAGITERLQALLSTDMCVPGSDGEMLTHEMLRMAQLGQQYECKRITSTYQRKRRGGGGSTS
ncbi:aminopeptidase P family protein [Sesbania bispinosa]|nr:aminopeptidase P family protein [Sesbania bispinosa]